MGRCPSCNKVLEAHEVVGSDEGLRVGDRSICIGCGAFLILTSPQYEFRIMTAQEWEDMEPPDKLMLVRARQLIIRDTPIRDNETSQNQA